MKNGEVINRRKGSQNKGRSRVGLLTESFSVFSVGRRKSHMKKMNLILILLTIKMIVILITIIE